MEFVMPKKLYKTTIVIWSEEDPREQPGDDNVDAISALAREAEHGNAYCPKASTSLVEDPTKDPDWDGTEFFDIGDEDSGDGGPPYDAATATGMYDHDD
jgi:hypothetical protein